MTPKKLITTFVGIIILAIAAWGFYYYQSFVPASSANFDLTFSNRYAQYLGFDPKQMYLDMLSDLKPKKIRLMAYWEDLEPKPGQFKFQFMDEMLTVAQKQNVDVILVLGRKQPRWPECHQPDWVLSQTPQQQQAALLEMLRTSVAHFKQFSSIKAWQVENEPYFVFGADCPKIPTELLDQEIQIIKQIDHRPVLLTESGERGNWNKTGVQADMLGVTMYRVVHNRWFGYYKYPVPSWFYRFKAGWFEKTQHKPIVGIELQAEPWFTKGVFNTDLDTQRALMNPKIFAENIAYARKVGFADNYLWGVEWWYWMAKKQNDWGMWAAAKDLLSNQQ